MHVLPRLIAVSLVSFLVVYVFFSHGFTMTALIESSIWLVIMGATMIAWGSHITGAVIFIALGVLYWFIAKDVFPMNTILFVSGPLILTGGLFVADKQGKNKRIGG